MEMSYDAADSSGTPPAEVARPRLWRTVVARVLFALRPLPDQGRRMRTKDSPPASSAGFGAFSSGGLIDRPARCHYWFVVTIVCAIVVVGAAVISVGRMPVPEIPAITPLFGAVVLTTDLSTGFLLLVMFRATGRTSLLVLACAYFSAGAMATLHVLTFPGVLARDSIVIGTSQSAAWSILLFWFVFGLLSLLAMILEARAPEKRVDLDKGAFAAGASLAALLVVYCGVVALVTVLVEHLPPLVQGAAFTPATFLPRYASIAMMATTVMLGLLTVGRRSKIFLWLSLAVAVMLCVNVMTLTSGGRGTLGWSFARFGWMFSASVLFLFFMGQFAGHLRTLSRVRTDLEQLVKERTADLERALHQRNLLLREVYHRVKNNIQVIDSMLFLERRRVAAEPSKDMVHDMIDVLRQRVHALGLVHQQLMSSEDMEYFDIAPFLRELVDNLGVVAGVESRGVTLTAASDRTLVNLDFAIPLGLLVADLVTSSAKDAGTRRIGVAFRHSGDGAVLTVSDDREYCKTVDAVSGAEPAQRDQGSQIAAGLVAQLDGRLEETRNGGNRVAIFLPLPAKGR